jgi:hypothetical protein
LSTAAKAHILLLGWAIGGTAWVGAAPAVKDALKGDHIIFAVVVFTLWASDEGEHYEVGPDFVPDASSPVVGRLDLHLEHARLIQPDVDVALVADDDTIDLIAEQGPHADMGVVYERTIVGDAGDLPEEVGGTGTATDFYLVSVGRCGPPGQERACYQHHGQPQASCHHVLLARCAAIGGPTLAVRVKAAPPAAMWLRRTNSGTFDAP